MLTVYEHPLSPYAQKVKIALREKGLEFEARVPDAIGSGASGGKFRHLSPRLEVPVLIDEELAIYDSTIILEYLEDAYPEPALLPSGAAARARARAIEDVMDTHYEAINWGLSEIRYFRRASGALEEELTAAARRQTGRLQAWLEEKLGDAEWFGGNGFGWTDLSVVPYVNGSVGFGLGPAAGSRLGIWLERAHRRPSVRTTAEEAAAAAAAMEQVGNLVERGLFKRQYRDHRLEWMIRSGGVEVVLAGLEADNIRFNELP